MKLTEHFQLSEFTRSATARRRHIDNSIDLSIPSGQSVVANLKNLCEQVLEPLRQHFNVPIVISSGYRCPALNRAVGGAVNSQHMTGEAADIHIPDTATGNEWFIWIMKNCDFDQLIKETADCNTYWIHISCLRNRNRNLVIRNLVKNAGIETDDY